MKIAFLHFYSGLASRGTEVFVHELANDLARENQVVVFQGGNPLKNSRYQTAKVGTFAHRENSSFLPVTHIIKRLFLDPPKLKQLLFTIQCLPELLRLRPEIIYPTDSGWQALICSILARLTGAKLVISGHSGPGWDDRWNLLVKPRLFVGFTHHQIRWAEKATIWRQQFAVIGSGVDLSQFKPAGKKFPASLEKPIILMVAASTPAKRVEQGIGAVARLKTGSLLLLGTGPLNERIDKLGYKLLGQKRFFHATADHDRIPEYYRRADLFALCSESREAFGTVYLEAMATGLPIVATADDSRREILANAAVFVKDVADATEYAGAITKALRLKSQLRKKTLARAKKFTWAKIGDSYQKEFDQLFI